MRSPRKSSRKLGQYSPERLRVIAFASVLQYKQSTKNIEEIGRELGVDYVLEGGVRWYGRRMRVTVRLIGARDQVQFWGDSFEIRLPSFLSLQLGLTRQLVSAMSAKLAWTDGTASFYRAATTTARDALPFGEPSFRVDRRGY